MAISTVSIQSPSSVRMRHKMIVDVIIRNNIVFFYFRCRNFMGITSILNFCLSIVKKVYWFFTGQKRKSLSSEGKSILILRYWKLSVREWIFFFVVVIFFWMYRIWKAIFHISKSPTLILSLLPNYSIVFASFFVAF